MGVTELRYCPHCGGSLVEQVIGGAARLAQAFADFRRARTAGRAT